MAFLTLNGITAPVQEGKWQKSADVIGASARSVNGKLRSTFVANKRKFNGTLIPLDRDTADAWRRLLLGEADYLSWDASLYSGKGVPPNAGNAATIENGTPLFGNYVNTNGSALSYTFGGTTVNWGVSVWKHNGLLWDHYFVRNNTAKWLNGVRNDATPTPFLTVGINNTVTLAAGAIYDDLFFMPFYPPDSWPVDIFAASTAMNYPELNAAGNAIDGGLMVVASAYTGTEVMYSVGPIKQREMVSFELAEF